MIALALAAVFVLCSVGAWISYTPAKHAGWAPWALAGLAAVSGVIWAYAARALAPERVFAFSLMWDCAVAAAYYALPVVLWGVQPTPLVMVGAGLVVAGLVLVHLGG